MEKVISVYERPYDEKQPVVTMDESPKQLIESTHFIGKDGKQYQDSIYTRHGVRDIYMAFEPLAGKRYCFVEQNPEPIFVVEVQPFHLGKDCKPVVGYYLQRL